MLKRLELVGFKSFADKTQFEFSGGITAVVGPNGSGKSNIVDAVRWILGEQSAKSLRGGEMADVIFNGSASRRSFGMAEVTMTFDNERGHLPIDGSEVQITRRVYRSGEGEYLINHQIARLKDIKDLFLGSGAGNDAYSIIEQGRVDGLLQASTKDRRSIFEEAAGISRFKAKKVETLRRLERVDQNLQRLRDIMDEVDKQLRSVKLQASKAQRYQEYSQRLKELRVGLGLQEYHQHTEQLQNQLTVLEDLRAGLDERAARADAGDTNTRRVEEALAQLETAAHEQEARLARARQRITGEQTTLDHEWGVTQDLEGDLGRTRSRLTELNARVAVLAEEAAQAAGKFHAVETQCQDQQQAAQTLEAGLQSTLQRLATLRQQVQEDKAGHFEQMQQSLHLQNDVISYKAQMDNLRQERERRQLKSEQAAESLATLDVELQELNQADEALQARLVGARQTLTAERQERERLRQQGDETTQRIADLRAQRSGLASRTEVLEGLERSHEGLGTGVREVFALLEQPDPGPWRAVLGMIADFLTVQREYAPLIDLALAERAQRFLVRDAAALAEALRQRGQPFAGRVSFLPLQIADGRLQIDKERGRPALVEGDRVIAWAEQLVSCDRSELARLPGLLLGNTLIVRDLESARSLQERWRVQADADPQSAICNLQSAIRFVTLQGELLEADGTLTVGTHHAETGILSRKSELRELRKQAVELDRLIAEVERDLAGLRERVVALDGRIESLQETIDAVTEAEADLRTRVERHRQRRENLHEEVELSRREISGLEQDIHGLEESWQLARAQAEAAEQQVLALQTRLEQAEREIRTLDQQTQRSQQEYTSAKEALARVEERLTALRDQHRQIEGDLQQRRQEQGQGEEHMRAARARLQESQRILLQASAALAQLYLEKEAAERQVADLARQREEQRRQRQLLAEQTQTIRNDYLAQQEQVHALDMRVNDLRHLREALSARLREDYQIELAELYQQAVSSGQWTLGGPAAAAGEQGPAAPAASPAALLPTTQGANDEIVDLKRKLSRLGSVNLDSLQELAELEIRAQSLQTQWEDLTAAQRSLQEIIAKINQDSRRLFTETFAMIRLHFQELFRKLFGGGMADIVLEDDSDILESGIEIIARPPGKELRSISLMSGGEKTLTAVALLLAIFRSKPSPFCILDEVDAALDEANIDRFTAVLRDFLDRSQFILITHSKKTMACADVLYGITMQESGISKRVAVRFEDWPDEAKPTPPAPVGNGEERSFAGR